MRIGRRLPSGRTHSFSYGTMLPLVRSSFRCRSAKGKQSPVVIAFQSIWPVSIFSRVKPNIFRKASFASKIRRREPVSTPRCWEARRNARESLTLGLGWLGHMNEGSPIGASPVLAPYIFLAYTRHSPGLRSQRKIVLYRGDNFRAAIWL